MQISIKNYPENQYHSKPKEYFADHIPIGASVGYCKKKSLSMLPGPLHYFPAPQVRHHLRSLHNARIFPKLPDLDKVKLEGKPSRLLHLGLPRCRQKKLVLHRNLNKQHDPVIGPWKGLWLPRKFPFIRFSRPFPCCARTNGLFTDHIDQNSQEWRQPR